MHFPISMRYARNVLPECLGMTGKFHSTWGDFHSFKNKAALEFECFHMLALNAKCSIGDQLHPSGRICPTTYSLIGSVYDQVEAKEPWCVDTRQRCEIGVISPEAFTKSTNHRRLSDSIIGSTRILQEGCHQFDILDAVEDTQFKDYKLLVLPDSIPVDAEMSQKLQLYLKQGGLIIASYQSGWDAESEQCTFESMGIDMKGQAFYGPDFVLPSDCISAGLSETEYVMYLRGMEVKPHDGTEVLAATVIPYFNRTYQHFCSHNHTPSSGKAGYPAILRHDNIIYFAHPIFSQYSTNAPKWCKQLVCNAIHLLLPDPLVKVEGPSTLLVTLNEQPRQERQVLHILHYIPERRGKEFDTIEDIIPVYNIRISVREDHPISAVCMVPQNDTLDFRRLSGRIEFTVPKVCGHQMVSLSL